MVLGLMFLCVTFCTVVHPSILFLYLVISQCKCFVKAGNYDKLKVSETHNRGHNVSLMGSMIFSDAGGGIADIWK